MITQLQVFCVSKNHPAVTNWLKAQPHYHKSFGNSHKDTVHLSFLFMGDCFRIACSFDRPISSYKLAADLFIATIKKNLADPEHAQKIIDEIILNFTANNARKAPFKTESQFMAEAREQANSNEAYVCPESSRIE